MSIEQSDQPESKTSTTRRRVLLAGAGIAALPLIAAAAGGASSQPSVTPNRQEAKTMSRFTPKDGTDTYADDLGELVQKLDLKDAIHVGHSTGGGEVARYIGRHGTKRVAKAVLIG